MLVPPRTPKLPGTIHFPYYLSQPLLEGRLRGSLVRAEAKFSNPHIFPSTVICVQEEEAKPDYISWKPFGVNKRATQLRYKWSRKPLRETLTTFTFFGLMFQRASGGRIALHAALWCNS